MTSLGFKWFQVANCFQTNWALAHMFKADYKYISIISLIDWAADGEFLDLHLKSVQGNPVYKEPGKAKLNSEHLF